VPDGPLTAAKIVEIFVQNGKLSNFATKYRSYPMARERFRCEKKYEVVELVKKTIKTTGKINEEDGIRVDEEDGWFLIRASGTEPIVRLTMEYKTRERLESKKKELIELIKKRL
jgi:phosphoglucosamine mutase